MPSETGQIKPLHGLTENDRGSIIVIISYTWVFLTATVASVRFGIAYRQRLTIKVDDVTYLFGVVFAIASSVALQLAVVGGMGRHISTLDHHRLQEFYKSTFAADLAGIVAMALAKTSVVLLSDRVAPREPRPFYSMLAAVILWAVFSIFATAFQCPLPRPWVYVPSECSAKRGLIYPIILGNIITDALLATWILPTLWRLLIDLKTRVRVIALFASRLLVCAVAMAQLIKAVNYVRREDQTWYGLRMAIFQICVIHLSVLLSTLPRTNRFLSTLHTAHATTHLTDFELAQPTTEMAMSKRSLSLPGEDSESNAGGRNRSASAARSNKSTEPLMRLTPSRDRNTVSTVVFSDARSSPERSSWKRFSGNLSKVTDHSTSSTKSEEAGPSFPPPAPPAPAPSQPLKRNIPIVRDRGRVYEEQPPEGG